MPKYTKRALFTTPVSTYRYKPYSAGRVKSKRKTDNKVVTKRYVDNLVKDNQDYCRTETLQEVNGPLGVFNEALLGTAPIVTRGRSVADRIGNMIRLTGLKCEIHINDQRSSLNQVEDCKPRYHKLYIVKTTSGLIPSTEWYKARASASTIAWSTEANARPNNVLTTSINTTDFKILGSRTYVTYGATNNAANAQTIISKSEYFKMDEKVLWKLNTEGAVDRTKITPQIYIIMYSWDPTKTISINQGLTDNYFAVRATYYWKE